MVTFLMFQWYKLLHYKENPAIHEMILVFMFHVEVHIFICVGGWFIQPTANSVLFEAIFHLHMLLLTHIIQIEFPILINGTNLFQF